MEKIVSQCTYEGDLIRYYDKEGAELHEGDFVEYPDGKLKMLYLTDKGELGIDATNPVWLENGKAVPCEYGIYPLNMTDLKEVVKK